MSNRTPVLIPHAAKNGRAAAAPRRALLALVLAALATATLGAQTILEKLGRRQDFVSKRVSSYDRTGGNNDSFRIEPGATLVLADIKGPGAIHHFWNTVSAEAFYARKLVLRIYWDGEKNPSVEAPLGDFFGVGHGLNRDLASLPIADSSEGRARNCYWYMPFRVSARVTVTNEDVKPVGSFYYYLDYRELPALDPDTPYFHAWYNQAFPASSPDNYVMLDARGTGHYVGCVYSVIQRSMGWWGEGDDMIYVDGETEPSLHGTGSEDYFCDAWAMREGRNLFYGCPLQEKDYQVGCKASVYRFHIPDPITFRKSIRVTIEHGHANNLSDYLSSVAFWYQTEPHAPFPPLPPVSTRLPFAAETAPGFIRPTWEKAAAPGHRVVFEDRDNCLVAHSDRLASSLLPFYTASGARLPLLRTDGAAPGTAMELTFQAPNRERYSLDLYLLASPVMGDIRVLRAKTAAGAGAAGYETLAEFQGYAGEARVASVRLQNVLLDAGPNTLILRVTGADARAKGRDIGLVGLSLTPSARVFSRDWMLIGPFNAPEMNDLYGVEPPETGIDLRKTYPGKNGAAVAWKAVRAEADGLLDFTKLVEPNEKAVVYGLAFIHSPDARAARLLLGSDDGVRVWLNGDLVHTNAIYRGASPDEDAVDVRLKAGWNKVLVKVLQGDGGWGLYLRLCDPDGAFKWSLEPKDK